MMNHHESSAGHTWLLLYRAMITSTIAWMND